MVGYTGQLAIVTPAAVPGGTGVLDIPASSPSVRKRPPQDMDWDSLPEPLQLTLAVAALRHAAGRIATQADTLAAEMESGGLQDRGGPDALRLLAAIVRVTGEAGLDGTLPG